ncbi:MAG: O-antigen ligase family protein [Alphaproteobacteria bacterium]
MTSIAEQVAAEQSVAERPAARRKSFTILNEEHSRRWFMNCLFAGFLAALALAPLPLGSNRMWSSSLLTVWNSLLLLILMAGWLLQPRLIAVPMKKSMTVAFALMLLTLAWIVLQTTSLTPESWHHPLWQEAAELLKRQGFKDAETGGAIALDSGAALAGLVRLLGYIASFWLAYFFALDAHRPRIILLVLVVAGLGYAAYGFSVQASGSNLVLWYPKRAYIDNMTSTFFNRNSYAAYAGLGMLCALAYMIQSWRRAWRKSSQLMQWRDFLAKLAGGEIIWVLPPVALLMALLLSSSRGGFASSMAGLAVLALGFAINKRLRWRWVAAIFGGAFVVIFMTMAIGGNELAARLDTGTVISDLPLRTNVYELTWEAIKVNPWFGYGYGNFDAAFRLFRDSTIAGWYEQAHDEYLEMAMDLGIPAALAWFTALGIMIVRCLRGMAARKKDGIYPVLALAATTLVGLHSILDFSLQIPAIAATYAAILGAGVAQSWTTQEIKDAAERDL